MLQRGFSVFSVTMMVLFGVLACAAASSARAAEFTLASDGYVVRDGKRIFLRGLFGMPTDKLATMKNSGFNAAAGFVADTKRDREFLRILSDHSMYGIVGVDTSQILERSDKSIRSFVKDYVSSLRDGPQPLAYLLPDEHVTLGLPFRKLVAVRDAIREVDADAILLYDDYTKKGATTAKELYDVFAWDKYPITADGESLERWRAELREVKAAVHPKPFWLTLQAWVNPPEIREPTRDELFAMAYIAIANGATGVIAWSYGTGLWDYPRLMDNLNALMAELGSLSEVLTLPDSPAVVTASVEGIDAKLKQGADRQYLIAANYKSGAKQGVGHHAGVPLPDVTFRISGLTGGTVRALTGAERGSPRAMAGGELSESFPPYAVRVFEITPETTPEP